MENYRIGDHLFDSEEDYKQALQDYNYSKRFMEKLDLRKPEMARKLYEQLAASTHLMQSQVGEAFKEKLVEIFVKQCVQEKKVRLQSKTFQTGREMIASAKKDRWFWLYWFGWKAGVIVTILDGAGYLLIGSFRGKVKAVEKILMGWNVFGIIGKYLVASIALTAFVLLLRELIRFVQHKPHAANRMNLLLVSGSLLCGCLYGMAQMIV